MAWQPDRLLAGFEALELAAPDDYDGRVVATLGRSLSLQIERDALKMQG